MRTSGRKKRFHTDDQLIEMLYEECEHGTGKGADNGSYDRSMAIITEIFSTLLFRTRVIYFLLFVFLGSLLTLLIERG